MRKRCGFLAKIFLAVLLLAVGISGCQKKDTVGDTPIEATEFKLNTVVKITIYDSGDESLLQEAMKLCDKYEALFSRTMEGSEIYQLNARSLPEENGAYSLSEDTAALLSSGLKYSKLSKGAFDITVEPVSSLWDFTSGEKIVPDQASIARALPAVGYENITLEGNSISFADDSTRLDLGGIAKGYIADKIKEYLVGQGVKSAIINLGGNVLCIGGKPDGSPFGVGIQMPFADRNETIAVMDIQDKSVVSSGIYERFFEKDGILYHHILNPKTGYPYDNDLVSVTIISDKSVDGDALSTTCFALGLEEGMDFVQALPGVYGAFITKDYEIHYSEGFQEAIPLREN